MQGFLHVAGGYEHHIAISKSSSPVCSPELDVLPDAPSTFREGIAHAVHTERTHPDHVTCTQVYDEGEQQPQQFAAIVYLLPLAEVDAIKVLLSMLPSSAMCNVMRSKRLNKHTLA